MFINVLCYSESHENAQVAMFEPVVRVSSVDVFEQRWIIVNTWSGNLFSGWNGGRDGERCVCDVNVCVLYRLKTLIIPRLLRFDLFIVHQMIFFPCSAAFGLPSINLHPLQNLHAYRIKSSKSAQSIRLVFSQSTAKKQPINVTFEKVVFP